jgi:hypothetical protein
MYIQFKHIGKHLGTRSAGMEMREEIIRAFDLYPQIVFDFNGVEIVSNSFADECFGKLIAFYGLEKIKSKTTFVNTSPFIKSAIANAIKMRMAA